MQNKRHLSVAIAIVIAINIALLAANFGLKRRIDDIDSLWRSNSNASRQLILEVSEFQRHFGYGGFIHHLKNYVIRRDNYYLEQAQLSLVTSLATLHRLDQKLSDIDERNAIEQLRKVVNEYHSKLNLLQQIAASHSDSIEPIDSMVRVNDRPALDALKQLDLSIEQHIARTDASTELAIARNRSLINIIVYVLHPVVCLMALLYLVYVRRINKSNRQFQAVFYTMPDALVIADNNGKILNANKQSSELLGHSTAAIIGMNLDDLVSVGGRDSFSTIRKHLMETLTKENKDDRNHSVVIDLNQASSELFLQTRDGNTIPVQMKLANYSSGKNQRFICSYADLRTLKSLEHSATTDSLTQLANRKLINEKLDQYYHQCAERGEPLSVILLDIDDFKRVNDQYGHLVGDRVLQQLASILKSTVREDHLIGRFGGEEFLIICPNTSIETAAESADKLRRGIRASIWPGVQQTITASFGVAEMDCDNGSQTISAMLNRADKALYRAKNAGKNQVATQVVG